jgi:hypothetical protein
MNKQLLITGLALILTSVVAVSKERTEERMVDMARMETPADASWVEIEIKAPPYTKPRILAAHYHLENTEKCSELSSSFQRQELEFELSHQEKDVSVYIKRLPVEGGGICDWVLKEVRFGLSYASIDHLNLGEGYRVGAGPAIQVLFLTDPYLAYHQEDSIYYEPELFVEYQDTESTGWNLGGDTSGKSAKLFGPVTRKIYQVNRKTIGDVYKITYAPLLDESKRAFHYSKVISAPGEIIKEDFGTIYTIDGTVVKETKKIPAYDYLEGPDYYIFGKRKFDF